MLEELPFFRDKVYGLARGCLDTKNSMGRTQRLYLPFLYFLEELFGSAHGLFGFAGLDYLFHPFGDGGGGMGDNFFGNGYRRNGRLFLNRRVG